MQYAASWRCWWCSSHVCVCVCVLQLKMHLIWRLVAELSAVTVAESSRSNSAAGCSSCCACNSNRWKDKCQTDAQTDKYEEGNEGGGEGRQSNLLGMNKFPSSWKCWTERALLCFGAAHIKWSGHRQPKKEQQLWQPMGQGGDYVVLCVWREGGRQSWSRAGAVAIVGAACGLRWHFTCCIVSPANGQLALGLLVIQRGGQ